MPRCATLWQVRAGAASPSSSPSTTVSPAIHVAQTARHCDGASHTLKVAQARKVGLVMHDVLTVPHVSDGVMARVGDVSARKIAPARARQHSSIPWCRPRCECSTGPSAVTIRNARSKL